MLTVRSAHFERGFFMEQRGMRLLQAFADVRRQVGRVFAGRHLSQSEFFVLKLLNVKSGEFKKTGLGTPRAAFLSGRLEMKRPTVSRILNGLERRGYIARTIDTSNRRSFEIHLTEAGERALRQAEDVMTGLLDQLETELGEAELEKLITLVTRVADIYRNMAGSTPAAPEEI